MNHQEGRHHLGAREYGNTRFRKGHRNDGTVTDPISYRQQRCRFLPLHQAIISEDPLELFHGPDVGYRCARVMSIRPISRLYEWVIACSSCGLSDGWQMHSSWLNSLRNTRASQHTVRFLIRMCINVLQHIGHGLFNAYVRKARY